MYGVVPGISAANDSFRSFHFQFRKAADFANEALWKSNQNDSALIS